MTRLAIVIVAYNARNDLARTLQSLISSPPTVTHQILVIDNHSTENVVEMVRTNFAGVRVIEAGENLGFARANNLGVRSSQSELVLLLNPDTVVPPGAIDTMIGVLDRTPSVAALGPRLVDTEGRPELSFGAMYGLWSELRRKVALALDDRGFAPTRRAIARATSRPRLVDWVSGACLLVRRADGEAVGWLDERYFMYAEDVDFCAALRAAGRAVLFSPAAEVVHLRGRSGLSRPGPTRNAWRASHLAFYRKHRPRTAPLLELYLRLSRGR